MKKFLVTVGLLAVASTLVACGGGSDPDPDPDPVPESSPDQTSSTPASTSSAGTSNNQTRTGQFIDSVVSGLSYSSTSFSGITNAQGEFKYAIGEKT